MTVGKLDLLSAIAAKNRGLLATKSDNLAILALISQLEDRNPNPRPLDSAKVLLDGNWRLRYTTSQELLGIDRFPLTSLREIYQCVRLDRGRIYNIAEVASLPFLEGAIAVVAEFEAISERRVAVKFLRSIVGLQRAIGYQSPDRLIEEIEGDRKFLALDFKINSQTRRGWIDITYLDEDLRIARGNEGSVFVLTKG
ncbi:PAP/fibrillin family protein [Oxynema aestuarii]|jgi:hypothetical protein|uniref:Fibrillin n=1 Tax=Oxynema aestuarii AP17 TaxID=2064643 RepID=A0A6H1TTH7_9CYAN|nr:PAP/fibrillin family protein [Oxynema aestuarii]QIZ69447.1 fibrillin [Oxynema aestuarii AP17]RMH76340.1 MAG: fibrillin [Cyanobacteria bacterium J007]